MSDEYRPIDCALYSGYELAIIRRQALRVHWREPDGTDRLATLRPLDLKTEATKEEFLLAEDLEGRRLWLRLDRIVAAQPVRPEPQTP